MKNPRRLQEWQPASHLGEGRAEKVSRHKSRCKDGIPGGARLEPTSRDSAARGRGHSTEDDCFRQGPRGAAGGTKPHGNQGLRIGSERRRGAAREQGHAQGRRRRPAVPRFVPASASDWRVGGAVLRGASRCQGPLDGPYGAHVARLRRGDRPVCPTRGGRGSGDEAKQGTDADLAAAVSRPGEGCGASTPCLIEGERYTHTKPRTRRGYATRQRVHDDLFETSEASDGPAWAGTRPAAV